MEKIPMSATLMSLWTMRAHLGLRTSQKSMESKIQAVKG